jgi:hypothetical protein
MKKGVFPTVFSNSASDIFALRAFGLADGGINVEVKIGNLKHYQNVCSNSR